MDVTELSNEDSSCSCERFAEDLLAFFSEIDFSCKQQLLWKKFEDFLKQKSSDYINYLSGSRAESCSQIISCIMLKNMKRKFREPRDHVSHRFQPYVRAHQSNKLARGTSNLTKLFNEAFNIIALIYRCETCYNITCFKDNYTRNGKLRRISLSILTSFRSLSALEGKTKFINLMVNLDMLPLLKNAEFPLIKMNLALLLYDFISKVGNISDPVERCLKTIDIKKTARGLFHGNSKEIVRRIYLSTIAIHATHLKMEKKDNEAKKYIYNLRMYFTTFCDPFITINEVRSVLYSSLLVLEKLELFERLSKEFLKLMPECSPNKEPRNLTDIVRCKIREEIKKHNRLLPVAIKNLDLPLPLKEFVLGNLIDMSLKNGNISPEYIISESQLEELVSLSLSS